MAIDPSFLTTTPEWSVGLGSLGGSSGAEGVRPEGGQSFASTLGRQLDRLGDLQAEAATQSQALATGQAQDVTAVVTAVERAHLSMQLASTLRTKGVDALTEVMRTTV
jgi:flagellar hook-basal body complex protein FliE